MITIEQRDSGEWLWRCDLPHEPGVGIVKGNRWDERRDVTAAVQRHYTKYHPGRRASTDLRRAWAAFDATTEERDPR